MPTLINERGYQVKGGGMPDLMTAKARQYRDAFDKRLDRLLREAKAKTSRGSK